MDEHIHVGLPELAPDPIEASMALHRLPEVFRKSRSYLTRQWSRELIEAAQSERLHRLLCHAVETVPAYQGHVSRAEIDEDPYGALCKFPVLEKRSLQDHLVNYVSDAFAAKRAFKVTTSGSTGTPLVLVDDEDSLVEYAAAYLRVLNAHGIEYGDRLANIVADAARDSQNVQAQLLVGACEVAQVNLLDSSSRLRAEAIPFLQAWRPTALFGNPSDLHLLSLRLSDLGLSLPSVNAIVSCGENLTVSARRDIENIAGCRVTELYSMQECKSIAWECPSGGFHIDDERVVLESLPHESGQHELILTSLCNYSMPLIRYRTGDLGCILPPKTTACSCGRALGMIAEFQGRDRGFLVTPDGRWLSPRAIKLFLTELPLTTWRLVQEEISSLTLEIAPQFEVSGQEICERVHRRLVELTFRQLTVDVRLVTPERLWSDGGKFQMMRLSAYSGAGNCRINFGE